MNRTLTHPKLNAGEVKREIFPQKESVWETLSDESRPEGAGLTRRILVEGHLCLDDAVVVEMLP
jgi:hypothetical protein